MLKTEKRHRKGCRHAEYDRARSKKRSLPSCATLVRGIGKSRRLEERLIDYAQQHGYRLLKELNLHAVTAFRATWMDAPLTAQKNLERLRAFFRFCMDRDWSSANPAAKLKVKVAVEQKDPFTQAEVERIIEATHLYRDGRWHVNQENAQELRTMVLVLRYSGLRFGDAVKLARKQLVPRSLTA